LFSVFGFKVRLVFLFVLRGGGCRGLCGSACSGLLQCLIPGADSLCNISK
jgi:hypothetical protein